MQVSLCLIIQTFHRICNALEYLYASCINHTSSPSHRSKRDILDRGPDSICRSAYNRPVGNIWLPNILFHTISFPGPVATPWNPVFFCQFFYCYFVTVFDVKRSRQCNDLKSLLDHQSFWPYRK